MRVLVTGANGQLGHDVIAACTAAGDEVVAAGRDRLDVTDRAMVHGAIASTRPDAVINCAAWTAVDACESDPDRAMLANALSVRWLREASPSSHSAPSSEPVTASSNGPESPCSTAA